MEYQYHYDNLTERQDKVAETEALGYRMLCDNFDPDWQPGEEPHGTLTYTDEPTPPPTPEEILLRELAEEANSYHTLAILAYNNYASLTVAQKDQVLKFLLGYYLTSAQRLGYFVI